MQSTDLRPYLRRLLIVFLISLALVFLISELAFLLQVKLGDTDRAPDTIELVIPEGTAEQVEAGQPVPSIPSELVFVLGDVLLVKNEDVVTHQLGPVFVPPNSSASLPMEEAENLTLTCSFQPSKFLGLEIKEPTTLSTRLLALLFATPPTVLIAYLYSLVAYPVAGRKDEAQDV